MHIINTTKFRSIYLAILLSAMIMTVSCSGKSAIAVEPEISTMDSVSSALEQTNKDLDSKTESLESSLENADKDLDKK